MNGPVISLEQMSKSYRAGESVIFALQEISLAIAPATFWAIMGPSGSGKSTLLNILGCLDVPTSGSYRLKSSDVAACSDHQLSELRLRHLGFIFQSFLLIPQLTVQENIALPLYYLGWNAAAGAQRAAELAEQVGLGGRLSHRPSQLSGGQQQRAAIARALANDPEILFADEPTGNLDTGTGEQIMALLDSLHQQGKTIIMVTHEPAIAAHATHQLHLRDGRIETVLSIE